MKKVVITGGSGILGVWVVKEFEEHGYEVINIDTKFPPKNIKINNTKIVDLNNQAELYGILKDAYAVVHLAAIPNENTYPHNVIYQNNVMTTYNVLQAADMMGIKKVVIASSECTYGIVLAVNQTSPKYVPMDEEHPLLPQSSYDLAKVINEETARMFGRRSGMQIVSFRIGNVCWPERYKEFPTFINESSNRKGILWSYIDTRDAATACRLAIEKDGLGVVSLNLAADNTSMNIKSKELMEQQFPEVKDFREPMDNYETLLSNKKAKELLGWKPVHNWREAN
jgi:nucleoside-diphosphate-sugar epimerase